MVLLPFLKIKQVKPKEATAWALLAYFPFGIWGALVLHFAGNDFQKKHANFSLLWYGVLIVWALITSTYSNFIISEKVVDNYFAIAMVASAFLMVGVLVLALSGLYAAYLSITGRYVAVSKLIE
jgi:hypothetical protein